MRGFGASFNQSQPQGRGQQPPRGQTGTSKVFGAAVNASFSSSSSNKNLQGRGFGMMASQQQSQPQQQGRGFGMMTSQQQSKPQQQGRGFGMMASQQQSQPQQQGRGFGMMALQQQSQPQQQGRGFGMMASQQQSQPQQQGRGFGMMASQQQGFGGRPSSSTSFGSAAQTPVPSAVYPELTNILNSSFLTMNKTVDIDLNLGLEAPIELSDTNEMVPETAPISHTNAINIDVSVASQTPTPTDTSIPTTASTVNAPPLPSFDPPVVDLYEGDFLLGYIPTYPPPRAGTSAAVR